MLLRAVDGRTGMVALGGSTLSTLASPTDGADAHSPERP